MPVEIRTATRQDVAGILEIYAPIVERSTISFEFEPPTETEMAARVMSTHDNNPWLVAELDGIIVGYAYATAFRSRPAYAWCRETSVYVRDGHRNRGIAADLMNEILDRLSDEGVRTVVAGVTLPNPGSVALHESLGFVPVGVFHGVGRKFDGWHDVGFWELDLVARPSG